MLEADIFHFTPLCVDVCQPWLVVLDPHSSPVQTLYLRMGTYWMFFFSLTNSELKEILP